MENDTSERPPELRAQRDEIVAAHVYLVNGEIDKAEQCLDRAERHGRTAEARLASRA